MAELAITDGQPPPANLPRGEFWATTLDDSSIRIDRADPRILISAELLDAIRAAPVHAELVERPFQFTYTGALLKLRGVNRTVIYRIGEYVPCVRCYIGEWPD